MLNVLSSIAYRIAVSFVPLASFFSLVSIFPHLSQFFFSILITCLVFSVAKSWTACIIFATFARAWEGYARCQNIKLKYMSRMRLIDRSEPGAGTLRSVRLTQFEIVPSKPVHCLLLWYKRWVIKGLGSGIAWNYQVARNQFDGKLCLPHRSHRFRLSQSYNTILRAALELPIFLIPYAFVYEYNNNVYL